MRAFAQDDESKGNASCVIMGMATSRDGMQVPDVSFFWVFYEYC